MTILETDRRRLDQVVFPATHNSYAASDQPGWRFAPQRYGIGRQLDDGIRGLLIDVHFGVRDPATGVVRTDLRAEGSDRNKVADPGLRLEQARGLAALCRRHGVPLIINDHLDLALAVDAEGLHIGGEDGSVADARRAIAGPAGWTPRTGRQCPQ